MHVEGRKGGDPKQAHARGKPRRRRVLECVDEVLCRSGDVLPAEAVVDDPPKHRLPVVFSPRIPAKHHLGSEDRVLIEDMRDAVRELEEVSARVVSFDEATQLDERRCAEQLRKLGENRPKKLLRVRPGGSLRRDLGEQVIDEPPREWKLPTCPYAEPLGELHRQPRVHAATAHHDALGLEGVGQGGLDHASEGVEETFDAVAPVQAHDGS